MVGQVVRLFATEPSYKCIRSKQRQMQVIQFFNKTLSIRTETNGLSASLAAGTTSLGVNFGLAVVF